MVPLRNYCEVVTEGIFWKYTVKKEYEFLK